MAVERTHSEPTRRGTRTHSDGRGGPPGDQGRRVGAHSRRVLDGCALAFLLLVTVLFHWPLITPDLDRRQSYPAGDFYDQFHAFATYEHDRLWNGDIPLWNPYNFGGHPFLADVQAAVLYPASLLVMLLSGPGPFSPLWLELEAMGHFYLAAAFTYLFVRRLLSVHIPAAMETRPMIRVSRAIGPLISALSFAFGGYLAGYPSQQLAILETQAWLPLILLLLDVGLAERKWRCVLGAGLAWGMALLAGHPQSAMYLFYGALSYALYRSLRAGLSWRRVALVQMTWIGIGVAAAAVHLVPAYEFMRLSVRSSLSYQELAGGFALRDMVQYLVPDAFTHWSPMYVGILPLFLAVMACALGWRRGPIPMGGRRSDVVFWLVLALVGLVLSLGGKAYLYRLFYWVVPGFRLFRSQERAIYLTGFSLAVLAGYGWQWLFVDRREGAGARRGSVGLLTLGIVSLAGIVAVWLARDVPGFEAISWLRRLSLLAGLAWFSWALVRWVRERATWSAMLGLALVMLDLGAVNMPRNLAPGPAEARVYDDTWLGAILQDDDLYRIANEWGLPGNVGCWLRRQDLYGASPLRLSLHRVMADALPHWRLWQLFDVRYVATWEHDLPGPFGWERVAMRGQEWAKDTVYAFRLEPDFPRAWVVHQARRVGEDVALALLADPEFDPLAEVLLPQDAPNESAAGNPSSLPVVEVTQYAPERIVVRADVSAPGWLVLGEWDYPGWQARVDGRRQAIYRADVGLRAVPVAAGQHLVEFRFRPASVHVGAAISLLALAASLALIIVARPNYPGADQGSVSR